jgi:hypothetical protein
LYELEISERDGNGCLDSFLGRFTARKRTDELEKNSCGRWGPASLGNLVDQSLY